MGKQKPSELPFILLLLVHKKEFYEWKYCILFLNIINREGQLILKNEQYLKKKTIYLKQHFLSCFSLGSVFF